MGLYEQKTEYKIDLDHHGKKLIFQPLLNDEGETMLTVRRSANNNGPRGKGMAHEYFFLSYEETEVLIQFAQKCAQQNQEHLYPDIV